MFDCDCPNPTRGAEALKLFRYPLPSVRESESLSTLGLIAARQKGDLFQGLLLCREAVRRNPEDPAGYYRLGKVHLLAGRKHLALYTFRKGLRYGSHSGLERELKRLGFRRRPLLPFLGRKHVLNRWTGMLCAFLAW